MSPQKPRDQSRGTGTNSPVVTKKWDKYEIRRLQRGEERLGRGTRIARTRGQIRHICRSGQQSQVQVWHICVVGWSVLCVSRRVGGRDKEEQAGQPPPAARIIDSRCRERERTKSGGGFMARRWAPKVEGNQRQKAKREKKIGFWTMLRCYWCRSCSWQAEKADATFFFPLSRSRRG